MNRTAERALALLVVLLGITGFSLSQVKTGTPPFGSFGGGPFDAINLGNLNVHFAVPIIHKAGRGLPLNYDLSFDSSVWYPVGVSGNQVWQPVGNWGWSSAWAGTRCYGSIPGGPFAERPVRTLSPCAVWCRCLARSGWDKAPPFRGHADGSIARCSPAGTRGTLIPGYY